jgi:uncharacterized repeat protein (TIGR02543 family)
MNWHKLSCRLFTNSKKSHRAVSIVIATLLMIAIAVVASLVAYAWVMGYIGATTRNVGEPAQIQSIHLADDGVVSIFVKNVGDSSITLSEVYVNDVKDAAAQFSAKTLAVQEIVTVTLSETFEKDQLINIRIVTIEGTSTLLANHRLKLSSEVTIDQYLITININSAGAGQVAASPPGPYALGTIVTLSPSANTGYTFTGWSGAGTNGAGNNRMVTVTGDMEVTATFAHIEYNLVINIVGSGTVSKNPIKTTYHFGDIVQLIATSSAGWSFSGWSGDLSGTTNPASLTIDTNPTVTATFTQNVYTISITITPSAGGSIARSSPEPYLYGEEITLTPTTNTGYTFTGWDGAGTNGPDNTRIITVTENMAVTATFTPIEYNLVINTEGSGIVTKNPNQATYHFGDIVQLTATPVDGWTFSGWSGDLTGTANPATLTIDTNPAVTATFTQNEYTVSVFVIPSSVSDLVARNASGPYQYGDVVILTASPNASYSFSGWTGDGIGEGSTRAVTVTGNMAVTATFTQISYSLTVSIAGSGSVSPSQGSYYFGDTVTLTATPAAGWIFSGWSGAFISATNPVFIIINGTTSVTATFTQNEYNLDVNVVGSGTVSKEPLKMTYHFGDTVILTATPTTGSSFSGWSGAFSSATNPVFIIINGTTSVTATFTPIEYTLVVNIVGSGSVSKNPDKATYHFGDSVQLTATPNVGWTFSGWSGDLSGTANPTALIIDTNPTVTATFTQNEYNLAINIVGSGSVSKNPDKATYHFGDTVQLTATPAAGWTFSSWSEDLTSTANPAVLTIDTNPTVTATFTRIEYVLSVNVVGGGTVSKNPNQATYHLGDTVTLTATPEPGWTFSGWSGDLTGTANPAAFTIDANPAVTATFTQNLYTISITITPSAGGSVSRSSPEPYHYGDVVTLTPTANTGYTFAGWSGDGTNGVGNIRVVTVTDNIAVTATFTLGEPLLTIREASLWSGSVTTPSGTVNFAATPQEGSLLVVVVGHRVQTRTSNVAPTPTIDQEGWNLAGLEWYKTNDSTDHRRVVAIFWKEAGPNEPTDVTINWNNADSNTGFAILQEFTPSRDTTYSVSRVGGSSSGTGTVTSLTIPTNPLPATSEQNVLTVAGVIWRDDNAQMTGTTFTGLSGVQTAIGSSSNARGFSAYSNTAVLQTTATMTGSTDPDMASGLLVIFAAS